MRHTLPSSLVAAALVVVALSSIVGGGGGIIRVAQAQSCSSTDLTADTSSCFFVTDLKIPTATVVCDYHTEGAVIDNVQFVSPSTSDYIISNCHQQSGIYNFTVPTDSQSGMKHIWTLAAFEYGTADFVEATIRLITADGDRLALGTLISGVNTAVQPEVVDQNSVGTMTSTESDITTVGYPLNGAKVCNGKLSYQQWDLIPLTQSLVDATIVGLEIVDPSHTLKVHAVSVSSCTHAYPTTVSGTHAIAALKAGTFATDNWLSSAALSSWAQCAEACAANNLCDSYHYMSSSQTCVLSSADAPAAASDTALTSTFGSGKTWNVRGGKSAQRGVIFHSQRNETMQQYAKKSQPSRIGINRRYLYKVLTTSDTSTYVKQPFSALYTYTIGVAQTNFRSSVVSAWVSPGGPTLQCGGTNTTNSDYFSHNMNGTDDQCDTYFYCPSFSSTSGFGTSTTPSDLHIALPPLATGVSPCTSQNDTAMKHGVYIMTDGVIAEPQHYYFYTEASTDSAVIAEEHALSAGSSAITLLPVMTLNTGAKYQRYTTGAIGTGSSPSWHWRDTEGAERSAHVVCESKSLLGYVLTHNVSHASTAGYNCDIYSTIFDIAAACDADDVCKGYSTKVSSEFVEVPNCLSSSEVAGTTADVAATFYARQENAITCTFPVQYATEATIMVTNAMPTANYTVAVDGVTAGSCTATDMTDTSNGANGPEATCSSFVTCYTGSITSGNSLTVTMTAKGPYNAKCPLYLFAARAEFSLTTAAYLPTAACTTAYSQTALATGSSICSVAATTSASCNTQNAFSLTIPTSYCGATDANGIWMSAATTNTYHVAVVLDFTSLASTTASNSAWFSVVADLSTGGSYHLGYISSTSTNGIRFVPRHRAGRSSAPLCSSGTVSTNALQNAQVFPIPTSLKDSLTVVRVRGPGGRVVAGSAIICPSFITPRRTIDRAFKAVLPGVHLSAPTYSFHTTTDFAACGALCGADAICFSYTFSAGGACHLKAGTGIIPKSYELSASSTNPTLVSGVATHLFTEQLVDLAGSSAVNTASLITQLAGANAVVFFMLPRSGSSGSAQVMFSNGKHFGVHVVQTGFAGSQVAITSSGGSLVCGQNYEPFATAQSSGGCGSTAIASCPVRTDTAAWSGSIAITPFYDTAVDLSGCQYPFMGYVHTTDGTFQGGTETLTSVLVDIDQVSSTVASLAAGGTKHVEYNRNITLDDSAISIIAYKDRSIPSAIQDPGASASATDGSGAFLCNLRSRIQYDVSVGQRIGLASTSYNTGAYATVQDASIACEADANCLGFEVSAGIPTSLTSSTVTTSGTTGNAFYQKHTTNVCTFTVSSGHFKLSIAENTVHSGANLVTVRLDGVLVRQCGGLELFHTRSSTEAAGCDSYLTCINEALTPTERTGELTVEFPAAATADVCGSYGSALLQYTAITSTSLNYMRAAATLNQRRTIRWSNHDDMGWIFRGQSISTVQLVLDQDRWDCGICTYQFALNLSVAGTLARGCAGALGFSEGRGLTGSCGTIYHCGPVTGTTGGFTPGTVRSEADGYSATLTFGDDGADLDTAASACDATFSGTIFTDGLLYSAQAGSHSTRMRYAQSATVTSTASSATSGTVAIHQAQKTNISLLSNTQSVLWPKSTDDALDVPSLVYLQQEFSMKENFESSASSTFAVYDVQEFDPLLQRLGYTVDASGTSVGDIQACVVDDISDETAVPGCFTIVDTNWLTVRVEQTAYQNDNEQVTISSSNFTTTCGGGDLLFFGFSGTHACGTYYTCYDGPVTPGDRVRISFSKSVFSSTLASKCNARAVALLEGVQKDSTTPVDCSGDTPFTCVPQSSCLAVSQLCDNTVDCVDDSDESSCDSWNYVMDNVVPTCDPILNITGTSAGITMTSAECERYGIANGATSLVVGNDLCMLYTCLSFNDPNFIFIYEALRTDSRIDPGTAPLETPTPTAATASRRRRQTVTDTTYSQLYVFTNDATSFKYCTAALHCNGNGVVSSTEAPCQCTCAESYVGTTCESVRDISLIDKFVVVLDPNATYTTAVLDTIESILSTFLTEIEDGVEPTIESVDTTTHGRSVLISVAQTSGATTNAVYVLLTPDVQARLVAALVAADTHTLFVTASSVVGTSVETQCRRTNITSTDNITCTHFTNVNSTKSVQVAIPGIALTTSDQWVEVDVVDREGAVTTLRCDYEDFTQSLSTKDVGSCGYISRCTLAANGLESTQIVVRAPPTINPDAVICEDFILDLSVVVEGSVNLPTEEYATVAKSERVHNDTYIYIAFALWGIAGLCLILLLLWFKARHDFDIFKYAGPVLAGLMFFCTFFAVCLWAFYVGSGVDSYTHHLIIEEYRDYLCGSSEHSFIPHRVSFIPADGNCHQLATIGSAEGILYLAASVSASNQPARIQIGGSLESCTADEGTDTYHLLPTQQCLNESSYFSSKTQLERQFISALALTNADTDVRIAAIKTFNPPVALTSATTVAALPSELTFNYQYARHFYTISGSEIRIGYPNDAENVTVLPNIHFMVRELADVPLTVAANDTDPERVRFTGAITTATTLFAPSKTVFADELPPIKTKIVYTDVVERNVTTTLSESVAMYTNYGRYFNEFKTDLVRTGSSASQDAIHIQGSNADSSLVDMGEHEDFTISFWLAADSNSRGIVYAVVDNWVDSSAASPIVDRLLEVIENSETTTPWFAETWNVYSAIYINGLANSIYFVWATPETGVVQLKWDTSVPTVAATRMFDGEWHFISIVFEKRLDRHEAQLFVDGETHFAKEGWRKCLPSSLPQFVQRAAGDSVNVLNQREETVEQGWLLLFGYVNAGIFDFIFHQEALPQEKLLAFAAPSMALYSKLAAAESLVLAFVMIILTVGGILFSGYEVYQHYFGFADLEHGEDEEEDENKGTAGTRGAHAASTGSNAAATGSTQTAPYWQFINPVTSVAQFMALYLGGWQWPTKFENFFGSFFSLISFDMANVVSGFPVLLPAAIQFFCAMIVLFAMLWLAIKDTEGFNKIVGNYKESRKERVKSFKAHDDDRPKPTYKWIVWLSNTESADLTPNQESVLLSNLTDMLTSRHKRDANMRLHTKSIVSLDELGSGIILYERVRGNVFVTFRSEAGRDADTGDVNLTLYSLEAVANNTKCPLHEQRLINIDTNLSCIHENNMLYRAMNCTREGQYYKCPDELCEFACCEQCYFHGAEGAGVASGALSGALAKIHELKKLGLAASMGTLVVLMAAMIYLPVVKNAMMVIFCHPTYQCEFGSCSTMTTLLIIAIMMGYITVVFIGVGIIVLESVLLRRRHKAMVAIIPMKKVRRKYNCRLLPQNIPERKDYEAFLHHDHSMLVSLYEPFEFQYFWMAPILLLFKGALIFALVVAEPNSLTQLASVCVIEAVQFLMTMVLSPYKNAFVEFIARLGSFHNMIQLGMMGLHRVEIRNDADADGYGDQMIWCSFLYIALVVLTVILVVVIPIYQNWKEQKERLARGAKGNDDEKGGAKLAL